MQNLNIILNELNYSYSKKYKNADCVFFDSTAPLEETSDGKYIFRIRDTKSYEKLLEHKYNVAAVVCNEDIAGIISKDFSVVFVEKNSERLFWLIHNSMKSDEKYKTTVGEKCLIAASVSISNQNVKIGNNVIIEENVVIRENVQIGDDSVIRAGCVIGGEGFQQYRDDLGVISIKHHGSVIIGENVEIQYNSCVDKGLYKYMSTSVSKGCRIDNLVQIGHNSNIQENVFIASGAVIGGYVKIGRNCFIGMNAAIMQHVNIGENCLIGMNSPVIKDVGPNLVVAGFAARAVEEKK